MKIRQLEYVNNIVQHKTMREAARQLFVTEPTISQQVRELEKEIGFPIFQKVGRGLVLTPQAEKIYPNIQDVLRTIEELRRNISDINNPNRGSIRFGIGPVSTRNIFPHVFETYNKLYPEVSLSVYEGGSLDLLDLLEKEELDVGIINATEEISNYMESKDIKIKVLYNLDYLLMVPHGHYLAERGKVFLEELRNEKLIQYRNGLVREKIIQLLGKEYEKNIICLVENYDSILELVKTGIGVSIVSKRYAASWAPISEQKNEIRLLQFADFEIVTKPSCICKQRRYYPEYLKTFIELITRLSNNS